MNALNQTSTHTRPVDDVRMDRMEVLLRRYPDLSDDELAELLRFVRKGPALEIGLLGSREELKPVLARLDEEHGRTPSTSLPELTIIALMVIAAVAAVILLWDSGTG